jgi:hypothetical protein
MVGFIRSSSSNKSCRRRLAQVANGSFSNCARPGSLHSFFFLLCLFGVAAEPSSLKLVLTVDFHVRHNYGQHLFMNMDSRYPVGHKLFLTGAESVLQLH